MKSLIVHADDFGLTTGISQGILKGFRCGIVTSSSILPNALLQDLTPLSEIREHGWDLGVHLNLTEGRALRDSAKLTALVNQDGHFRGPSRLLLLGTLKLLPWDGLQAEMEAQIERVLEAGIPLSHLDCHHHIHLIPEIFHILLKLARRYGFNRIRQISESLLPYPFWSGGYLKVRRLQAYLAHRWARNQGHSASVEGVSTPYHFFGIAQCGHRNPAMALRFLVEHLPEGVSEFMCHPGLPDPATLQESYDPLLRLKELNALVDPHLKEHIASNGIQLVSYKDL